MKIGTKVKVVIPFESVRTPCPKIGTVGQIVFFAPTTGFYTVNFDKPITDTDGGVWPPADYDDEEYNSLRVKFYENEIEIV